MLCYDLPLHNPLEVENTIFRERFLASPCCTPPGVERAPL
jgi:hypothetical protein